MENSFSDRIRKLRQDMDITQSELANKLGITTTALSFFESGSRIPNIEVLRNMATIFNVSSDYLLGLSEKKEINSDLKTYADMIRALISILSGSDRWIFTLKEGDFKDYLSCIKDDYAANEICNMSSPDYGPYDPNGTYEIGVLKTIDVNIISFLKDYSKILDLYENDSMPGDLMALWINDRLEKLKDKALPK